MHPEQAPDPHAYDPKTVEARAQQFWTANKAFEVRMQPDGRGMEWIERSPQGETRYTTEPGAGPLKRSWIDLLEILPIEWLL